jgi:hypothetical protein
MRSNAASGAKSLATHPFPFYEMGSKHAAENNYELLCVQRFPQLMSFGFSSVDSCVQPVQGLRNEPLDDSIMKV